MTRHTLVKHYYLGSLYICESKSASSWIDFYLLWQLYNEQSDLSHLCDIVVSILRIWQVLNTSFLSKWSFLEWKKQKSTHIWINSWNQLINVIYYHISKKVEFTDFFRQKFQWFISSFYLFVLTKHFQAMLFLEIFLFF